MNLQRRATAVPPVLRRPRSVSIRAGFCLTVPATRRKQMETPAGFLKLRGHRDYPAAKFGRLMLPLLISDLYNYLALAVLLLAILFGYRKGRNVASVGRQSLDWTQVPLIAFAIASLGPSSFAIILSSWLQVRCSSARTLRVSLFHIHPRPAIQFRGTEPGICSFILGLPPVAELRLGPLCDVVFRGRDGPPQMFSCFLWLGRWFPTSSMPAKASVLPWP